MSVGESLAKSLAEILSETLGETLGETFCAKESRQESCRESRIGSYAWHWAKVSPRLVFFFTRGNIIIMAKTYRTVNTEVTFFLFQMNLLIF